MSFFNKVFGRKSSSSESENNGAAVKEAGQEESGGNNTAIIEEFKCNSDLSRPVIDPKEVDAENRPVQPSESCAAASTELLHEANSKETVEETTKTEDTCISGNTDKNAMSHEAEGENEEKQISEMIVATEEEIDPEKSPAEEVPKVEDDDDKGSDYNSADEAQASVMEVSNLDTSEVNERSQSPVQNGAKEEVENFPEKDHSSKLETSVDDVMSTEISSDISKGSDEETAVTTAANSLSADVSLNLCATSENDKKQNPDATFVAQKEVTADTVPESEAMSFENVEVAKNVAALQLKPDDVAEALPKTEEKSKGIQQIPDESASESVPVAKEDPGTVDAGLVEQKYEKAKLDEPEEERVIERRRQDSVSSEEEEDAHQNSEAVDLDHHPRESGDGQEENAEDQAPDEEEEGEEEEELDDDEDRKNPAFVPKLGVFYQHDRRNDESEKSGEPEKLMRSERAERWKHDMFHVEEQAPKSRDEMLYSYGYDIRKETDAPKGGDRPRHYNRSQKSGDQRTEPFNSSWRGKPWGRARGRGAPSNTRQDPQNWDRERDFPALGDQGGTRDRERQTHENRQGQQKYAQSYQQPISARREDNSRRDRDRNYSNDNTNTGRGHSRGYSGRGEERRGGFSDASRVSHAGGYDRDQDRAPRAFKNEGGRDRGGFSRPEGTGARRSNDEDSHGPGRGGYPTIEFRRGRGFGPKPGSWADNQPQHQRRPQSNRHSQYQQEHEQPSVAPRFQQRSDNRNQDYSDRKHNYRESGHGEDRDQGRKEQSKPDQTTRGAKRYSTQRQHGRQSSPLQKDRTTSQQVYPPTTMPYASGPAAPMGFQPPTSVQPQFVMTSPPIEGGMAGSPAQFMVPQMAPPPQEQGPYFVPQPHGAPAGPFLPPAMIPYQAGPMRQTEAPAVQPGMVFYDPESQQMVARPLPNRRPKKGIPIVAPSDNKTGPSPSPPPQEPTSRN